MEVPCCPKCSKESYADMRPNDPIVSFYSKDSGSPFIRECNSCGQRYCMSWKQWMIVILLNSIFFAFLGMMPGWNGIIVPLLCFGALIIAEPLIIDAAQHLFSWKPVDAPYLDSVWRQGIKTLIIMGSIFIGTYLITILLIGKPR